MNWSDYTRFVGDIFGAPLAIEGLLAFFLESTFLGLWIFGWDRLPEAGAPGRIWLASIGTMLSAYFILAANSWMQHPVGSDRQRRPPAAPSSPTSARCSPTPPPSAPSRTRSPPCFVTAGHVRARRSAPGTCAAQPARRGLPARRCGSALVTVLIAGIGVVVTGDLQARLMTEQQPMKMAAAEALYDTVAPGVVLAVHHRHASTAREEVWSVRVPACCRSWPPATLDGTVEGINDLQARRRAAVRPRRLPPEHPGHLLDVPADDRLRAAGRAARRWSALWLTRARAARPVAALVLPRRPRRARFLPFAANSVGWIFTEMGRQPWVGLRRAAHRRRGLARRSAPATVLTSLIVFTAALRRARRRRRRADGPLRRRPARRRRPAERRPTSDDARGRSPFAY